MLQLKCSSSWTRMSTVASASHSGAPAVQASDVEPLHGRPAIPIGHHPLQFYDGQVQYPVEGAISAYFESGALAEHLEGESCLIFSVPSKFEHAYVYQYPLNPTYDPDLVTSPPLTIQAPATPAMTFSASSPGPPLSDDTSSMCSPAVDSSSHDRLRAIAW